MFNTTARILFFFAILILSLPGCVKDQQRSALVKHEEKYPDIRKKYVYQSILRLANVQRDPDYELLIRDLHKVILYLPPRKDSTYQIASFKKDIVQDGYEQLIDVRTADATRLSLWVNDTGAKPHYFALVDVEKMELILEMDGQIRPEYLSSLATANHQSLQDLLESGF